MGDRECFPARVPFGPGLARVHRDRDAQAGRARPPSPARTSSRSTTSASRPISRRARSSTSRCWSGFSSGSSRSGRSSAQSRMTPSATSRSTSRSTPSSASSATTATCSRSCARSLAGWSSRSGRMPLRPLRCSASTLPGVPEEFPVIHFRDALATVAARTWTSPTSARRTSARSASGHERARLGLPCGGGLPDGQATVLHPPAARSTTRAGVQQLRPAVPRAGAGHRAGNGFIARATTPPRWPGRGDGPGASYAAYLDAFRTGCRRMAGSRSGSSAGSAGWPAPTTSARSPSSRGT